MFIHLQWTPFDGKLAIAGNYATYPTIKDNELVLLANELKQ